MNYKHIIWDYNGTLLNDVKLCVTIINEMIAEYIVVSTRKLSPEIEESIQKYLDKIELSRSSRQAYYNFYKSVKSFFISHFHEKDEHSINPFFPFKHTINNDIEIEMLKVFNANKKRKSHLFYSYSELMERVRVLRNDLAHGNNVKTYTNITKEIEEILVDFKYLAIDKNFLQ